MLPTVQTGAALRVAGKRAEIHPHDAVAFIYPDRAYFEASAQRDREIHHNDVIGPLVTDAGLIGIVDMRRQLREMGASATDPAFPDDAPDSWRRRNGG
jgi:hypothetical protein